MSFKESNKEQAPNSHKNHKWIAWLITILVFSAIIFIGIICNILWFRPGWWTGGEAAIMGQRGDFFGGFLNPILTTLTFAAFLATVLMQRAELENSRQQFEQSAAALESQSDAVRAQNYQANFFQLLTMYDGIANSMTIRDPVKGVEIKGREAFRVMYSNIRRTYRSKREKFPKTEDDRVIRLAYDHVYKQERHQIPHYFRFLFNTLTMIEDGPEASKYIKILRASISDQELLVLYYNCVTSVHGEKFKALAERHALFNNMPPHLLDLKHADLIGSEAFGPGGYAALLATQPRERGDFGGPGPKTSPPEKAQPARHRADKSGPDSTPRQTPDKGRRLVNGR